METQKLYDYLQKDELDQVIKLIKSSKLEELSQKSFISRLFTKLDEKLMLNDIIEILYHFANDYSSSIEYEYNQGLKILLNRRQFVQLFEIIFTLLNKKKKLDNLLTLVQDLLNNCYDQKRNIEKCVDLILALSKSETSISDKFWGTNILALLRLGMMTQGLELIKAYPVKVRNKYLKLDRMLREYLEGNSLAISNQKKRKQLQRRKFP
jgi:hypothetical protein